MRRQQFENTSALLALACTLALVPLLLMGCGKKEAPAERRGLAADKGPASGGTTQQQSRVRPVARPPVGKAPAEAADPTEKTDGSVPVENDTAKAFDALQKLPLGIERLKAVRAAVTAIAESNPEQLLETVLTLDPLADQDLAESAAFAVAAVAPEVAPKDAVELAGLVPPGGKRHELLETLAGRVATGGIEQAEAWAMAVPDAELRDAAVFGAAVAFGTGESLDAWIGDALPEVSMRDAALAAMAVFEPDLELAKRMVSQVPEGLGRNRGMVKVVERMMLSSMDEMETAGWIEALPAGESRDFAYQECVFECFLKDRVYRRELADRITDVAIRRSLDRDLAKLLLITAKSQENVDWIRNSSLSVEEQDALLRDAGL